jgi:hypothetical protein
MGESYFANYPLYLKYTDIMDILQVSKAKAYTMMNEMQNIPGIVFKQGGSVRVHRDRFFNFVAEQSGMKIPS